MASVENVSEIFTYSGVVVAQELAAVAQCGFKVKYSGSRPQIAHNNIEINWRMLAPNRVAPVALDAIW